MAEEKRMKAPPYLPLKTLLGALDALREGVPKRIDRGIWRSQSGAVQAQIMVALRFLGLLDDDDLPTMPLLEKLAKADEVERKTLLKALFEKHFRSIVAHDLTKVTPSMLNDEMGNFGITGDTLRKAVRFFLQLAKYLEVPMSPFLKDSTRTSPKTRRATRTRLVTSPVNGTAQAPISPSATGSSKSVILKGGGTLTMTVTADVWSMPADDRKFVLEIIDKIQSYEQPATPNKTKEKAAGHTP